MDLISNQFDSKEWRQWGQRRSRKIKLSSYITIILFCFIAYLPILKGDLLWNDYDQVVRSFFPSLNSWTEIFNPTILWNENPLALLSYFLETLLPFNDPFSHRLINISLHCFASVLLLKLLKKMQQKKLSQFRQLNQLKSLKKLFQKIILLQDHHLQLLLKS